MLRNLVALALLVRLATLTGGSVPRNDLFICGDHPGQFVRLWYSAREGSPLLGWRTAWYAGYPELLFYPPGFGVLGWGLDLLRRPIWRRQSSWRSGPCPCAYRFATRLREPACTYASPTTRCRRPRRTATDCPTTPMIWG